MRQRSDALGMMSNPLVGTLLDMNDPELSEEMILAREEQREHELRLLGTFLFQAFFLALCILLYERWEWSQFNSLYEAMVFWFTASFALQAGFYFVYRAGFEDSNSHRKGLRRMRQSNKRRLAMLKYQQEKIQLEQVLNQQLIGFQRTLTDANSDGIITPQENTMLGNQLAEVMKTMQQLQGTPAPQQKVLTPADVGLGRMDIMGLPIGPKLTVASIPDGGLASGQASFQGGPPNPHLNLQPSGTREEQVIQNAQQMEAINEQV
jgi:hypothetical protein